MIFRSYRKRKAIESYHTVLARRLRGVHGRRDHYLPAEVIGVARAYRLSETYLCYALAIFCDRATFDDYHAERGDVACSYDRLWHELSAMATGSVVAASPDASRLAGIVDISEALSDASDGAADGGAHDAICGYETGGGYDAGGGSGSCD